MKTTPEKSDIKSLLAYGVNRVKRPAKGKLQNEYLVPGGPYDEQWDWDAFFIGMSLIQDSPENGSLLRNWALNYIQNADENGKVAGCLTSSGWDPRLHQMKPFLAQGCYFASKALEDFSWMNTHWEKLKLVATYRVRNLWSRQYGLGIWFDSMESGADNNPAVLEYPFGTVMSVDLNAFLYRELVCLHLLADKLGKREDRELFGQKATQIRESMLAHMWDACESSFWNIFAETGRQIKRVSYSNFIALWAGIAPMEQGRAMIAKYLTNPEHMWTRFGIRSLSKQDPVYNNINMIKPYSNWQGPVWPIANYMYMHALLNYGFVAEARVLSRAICDLVTRDIESSSGMHENYSAEDGKPLAAPDFVSWNLLVRYMPDESEAGNNPFKLPIL